MNLIIYHKEWNRDFIRIFEFKNKNFRGSFYESLTSEVLKPVVSDTVVQSSLICHISSNHTKFDDCDLSDDEVVNIFGRIISGQRRMSQECEKVGTKV